MSTLTLPTTGTWVLDPTHTTIGFTVKHLMAAKVRGSFKAFSGDIRMGASPESSSVSVSIDSASIDTGVVDRDAHLRGPDFLAVDRFPALTFASTSVEDLGNGSYRITGDLTIKDVTNTVTLDLAYGGLMNDPWGNTKAIFSAQTKIDRETWGLTWNAPLEAGGWLVGKEVTIEIEAQAAQA